MGDSASVTMTVSVTMKAGGMTGPIPEGWR